MNVKKRESGGGGRSPTAMVPYRDGAATTQQLPLVVTLNCIEDISLEQDCLSGIADVEHVPLSRIADARIETAAAVLLHSLAFLPRAAQRRLRPWQLILCLGSSDRVVDSALASDLGLSRLVHVDVSRAEEVADTVMALILGLLRRTHLLSRHVLSASGWLGSVQPLCRGMRRCRGLVLGIIGRSASAKCLATRSLAFKMSVLYFDVQEGQSMSFPSAARKMDTLNDLLAASDLISLHCTLTDDTVQIINSECLQHVKPGAFLVNTGSSQLLDDCAVKQLLIDGTLAGCALDGAEGPQWMEAWVREMPNFLILPRSADYSEEVWLEIREKSISLLQSFFFNGEVPKNAVSDDEEEESVIGQENSQHAIETIETRKSSQKNITEQSEESTNRSEGKRSRSNKKAKKKQKSHVKTDDSLITEDQVLSSSSHEDIRNRKSRIELIEETSSTRNFGEMLKDGYIIALHTRDNSGLHVSRQRVQGGGWFLDTLSSATRRDPSAQFLVTFRNKDTIGLRSFTSGGKLLQINRRMEFVFASHSFDVWESWTFEGSFEECRLINCRNPSAVLDVCIEVLATVGEDGITRWLD